MTTVVIVVLVIALWSTWRTLRRERRIRDRQMYLLILAARDAGKSDEWISEAFLARGFPGLPPDTWPDQQRALRAYHELLEEWRELGLSPRQIRKQYRQFGWPIPPKFRGDLLLKEEEEQD